MPTLADQTKGVAKKKPEEMTPDELAKAESESEGFEKARYTEEKRKRATRTAPPPTPTGTGNVGIEVAPERRLKDLSNLAGELKGSVPEVTGPGVAGTKATAKDIAAPGVIESRRANIAKTFADVVKTGSTAELQAMVTSGKGPDGIPLSLPQTAELRAVLKTRGVR